MNRRQELCRNFQRGRYEIFFSPLRLPLPRRVVDATCSAARLALSARTSNQDHFVTVMLVMDDAAASTERSAGSCTRPPLSSSSRRSPTRLGSAPRAGSSSLRLVGSSSSSSNPILSGLECKVGLRSPETLLALQRFDLCDGDAICFYDSSLGAEFSTCNGCSRV